MAWAEVPAKVACTVDRDTAQVSADTQHNEPLGSLTRSLSSWGSLRADMGTLATFAISSSVRWRTKTGLPRHFTVTAAPGSMLPISTSVEARASTSAEALMLAMNFMAIKRMDEA